MKVRNTFAVMIAVMFAFIAPMKASAQTSDSTKACYVPTTGNVYRIGVGSTPAACRPGHGFNLLGLTLPMHREINWLGNMLSLRNLHTATFGSVAQFEAAGNGHALKALANSTGPATIHAENANTGAVLFLRNTSTGQAMYAEATRVGGPAAHIENKGAGAAIFAKAAGGTTVNAENTGATGSALRAVSSRTDGGPAAHIEATTAGGGGAVYAKSNSGAPTINVENVFTGAGPGTAVRANSANGYALMAQSARTDGPTAHIENTGTGGAIFAKSASGGSVLYAENMGTSAGNAINAKSASGWNTVDIANVGTGGGLSVTSVSNNASVNFSNTGTGNAIYATSANQYSTAFIQNTGTVGGALNLKGISANANVMNIESVNGGGAIYASSNGGTYATAGFSNATAGGTALYVSGHTNLNGNTVVTGNFHTNGNTSVSGGTKSASVPTSVGKRLMYTEEATEVWFTDYGFGRLQDGETFIAFDALYAETVNVNEPYHVFIQAYGPSELYVTDRTATGFKVKVAKGDATSEFSYRIVAKRLNFERDRLESAGN